MMANRGCLIFYSKSQHYIWTSNITNDSLLCANVWTKKCLLCLNDFSSGSVKTWCTFFRVPKELCVCVCVWISSNVRARERAEKEHSMKLIRVLRNKRCLLPWLFSQWTKVATGKRLYSFDDVNACENEITKTLCAKFTQLTCQQQWQIAYTTIIPATAGAAASSSTSKNTHLHTHTHRIAWITSHNPNKYGWNLY